MKTTNLFGESVMATHDPHYIHKKKVNYRQGSELLNCRLCDHRDYSRCRFAGDVSNTSLCDRFLRAESDLATDTRNAAYSAYVGRKMNRDQKIVYETLQRVGHPMSNLEVSTKTGLPVNVVSGRMNELRIRVENVKAAGKRKCKISGRTVQTWEPVK